MPTSRRAALQAAAAAAGAFGAFRVGEKGAVAAPGVSDGTSSAAATAQAEALDFAARSPDRAHVFSLRRGGFGGRSGAFAAPLSLSSSMEELAPADVLFFGEHHDSDADHRLQVALLRQLQQYNGGRKLAIGLEMVQTKFQPVLDKYCAGKISEGELFEQVEWADRWRWDFGSYLPLFRFVREANADLVALNTDSESIFKVETGGLGALSKEERHRYVIDPKGFAQAAQDPIFLQYVKGLLLPSYVLHKQLGLLKSSITGAPLPGGEQMTFANFFAGRILWDETMATSAVMYMKENPKSQNDLEIEKLTRILASAGKAQAESGA